MSLFGILGEWFLCFVVASRAVKQMVGPALADRPVEIYECQLYRGVEAKLTQQRKIRVSVTAGVARGEPAERRILRYRRAK